MAKPFAVCASAGLLVLLTGCSETPRTPAASATPSNARANPESSSPSAGQGSRAPAPGQNSGQKGAAALAPPKSPRTHDELRLQAAHRLIEANPQHSYTGTVPDILLAIPVLEVDLNRDGSIKRITVLRRPRQESGTIQLAIDALHRAAPFGDLSRLPSPWRFTETFLFNDDRRFKPRSLD